MGEEFKFNEEMERVHYPGNMMDVYPIVAIDEQTQIKCCSYLCINKAQRGKFMHERAIELGCHPKKHFKYLANGESVVLDNGDVVEASMVLEEA